MASFACVLQTSCQFIVFVLLFEYIYLEKKSFVCCDISSLSEPWYHSYFCGGAVICTFPVLFFVVVFFLSFFSSSSSSSSFKIRAQELCESRGGRPGLPDDDDDDDDELMLNVLRCHLTY